MHTDTGGEYLKSAVMTATPEKLQLMLYDGAIRFGRQARDALTARNFETSCEKLLRAQQIVTAMEDGLRHEVNAQLCRQMAELYQFVYGRLVAANIQHDVTALDEALQILEHQRETWRLLIEKTRESTPTSEKSVIQSSAVESTLCLQA